MGGGGPSYPISSNDIDELENIAREEISRERKIPRKHVFISFGHEDETHVNKLRDEAKDKDSDLDFIDYSLRVPFDSEDANYIKRGIKQRIIQSSVTIVVIGEKTHQSEWVDWEIKESLKLGKPVIAVKIKEDPSIKIPKALLKNKIVPISWDYQTVQQAIEDAGKQ